MGGNGRAAGPVIIASGRYRTRQGSLHVHSAVLRGSQHVACGLRAEPLVLHPASGPIDTTLDNRLDSDRLQLLSGDWQFRYYGSIHDLDAEVTAADAAYAPRFFDVDFDTAADYATLPVPSVWQMHGYDHNQYTNTRYPFPLLDPPYVPADNPCAVYRRTFDYTPSESAPRAYLNFEGRGQLFLCVAQRRVHRLFARSRTPRANST